MWRSPSPDADLVFWLMVTMLVILILGALIGAARAGDGFLTGVRSINVEMTRERRHGAGHVRHAIEREREADRRHCKADPEVVDCFRTYNGIGRR